MSDIEYLRALPSQAGICDTVVVPVPKLARDWLCDRSELADRLYDALQLMLDELQSYEHFGPVEQRAFEQAREALTAANAAPGPEQREQPQ